MTAAGGDGFPGGAGDLGGCGAVVGVSNAELSVEVVAPAPEGVVDFCRACVVGPAGGDGSPCSAGDLGRC